MKVAIIACIRQEERYIKEWLDYHIDIGVSHFYLADNNNKNNTTLSDTVADYIANDLVTIIDCRGMIPVQPECYNIIMERYGDECDWYAMIDVDEFLHLEHYNTIVEFLETHIFDNADIVYFHWRCYGDSGRVHYENRPVQERFIIPANHDDGKSRYIKSIFRKKSIIEKHIHQSFTITDQHCVVEHPYLIRKDCLGNLCLSNNIGYTLPYRKEEFQVAYIKHYITKSLEEFLENKCGRCGAYSTKDKYTIEYYFSFNDRTQEKMNYIKSYGL